MGDVPYIEADMVEASEFANIRAFGGAVVVSHIGVGVLGVQLLISFENYIYSSQLFECSMTCPF